MSTRLPSSRPGRIPMVAMAGAVVMATMLYMIIPISQVLQGGDGSRIEYREIEPVIIDPPEPPEVEEEEPEEEEPEEEMPELPQEMLQIELTQLDISLNPGMGDAVAMGIRPSSMDMEADTVGAIQDIFEFDDLANPPSRINTPRYDYPRQLERRGIREIRVVVEILIDESGRARFQRILETSYAHASVDVVARSLANQVRFTVTEIEGRPVKVRARFPITLKSSR